MMASDTSASSRISTCWVSSPAAHRSSLVASIARRAGMTWRLPRERPPRRCARCVARASRSRLSARSSLISMDGCSPRLFEMVAPDEIRAGGCLVVMGSEGRGEQTVRTDQDNGLILAGPVDKATLDTFRADFSTALADFGFPPCPGNVMVRNSFWSKPLSDYLADFRRWVALPDEVAHMNVAFFYDARTVGG